MSLSWKSCKCGSFFYLTPSRFRNLRTLRPSPIPNNVSPQEDVVFHLCNVPAETLTGKNITEPSPLIATCQINSTFLLFRRSLISILIIHYRKIFCMISPAKTKSSIIAAGILLSVLLYLLVSFAMSKFLNPSGTAAGINANSFFLSRLVLWFYLLLVYIYVLKVEKQNFLLWPEKKYSILFYLISVVAILAGIIVVSGLLHKVESYYGWDHSEKLKVMLQILWKNKLLLLFTTLSAGIMEELLFRGYLMPRLQLLLKNRWLTIIISSLLFAMAHYSYGSLSQIINPLFIGIIFAWHYQKYRNIKVLMLCHFLIDFISVLTTH